MRSPDQLRALRIVIVLLSLHSLTPFIPSSLRAQQTNLSPIAIIPLDVKNPPTVTGSMEVTSGRAIIANNGTIIAGDSTAEVTLPNRGKLLVCATTAVKLAAGTAAAAGEIPGLLIAFDRGALETSFATGRNSDVIMTPDFRILIGGPGPSQLKVRLGDHGDTCVDNPGPINPNQDAPYVLVTGVFEGGAYRVQPGQRVMFQHGSTREVVDNEKEPCGCPPAAKPETNEFPLAQSAGLAPLTSPKGGNGSVDTGGASGQIQPLVRNGGEPTAKSDQPKPAEQAATPLPSHSAKKPEKKRGFFGSIGHFFRQVFGAE